MEPTSRDAEHFRSIAWCRKHLAPANNVVMFDPGCRRVKASTEDTLYAQTLNTAQTISAFMLFYERPADDSSPVEELKAFVTLGSGLDGFAGVCHGGIVATILDEVLGLMTPLNRKRGAIPPMIYMTAFLNTTYVRPVATPGTYLVTARIVERRGRKLSVEGRIWDENSDVLAKADALFVGVRGSL